MRVTFCICCCCLAGRCSAHAAVLMSSPRLRARRPLAALVAAVCGVRGPCGTAAAATATTSTIQSATQGATVAGRCNRCSSGGSVTVCSHCLLKTLGVSKPLALTQAAMQQPAQPHTWKRLS
eukprot:COSAG01_NODE_5336_length_4326_cov_2.410457_1_plen_122_part_00